MLASELPVFLWEENRKKFNNEDMLSGHFHGYYLEQVSFHDFLCKLIVPVNTSFTRLLDMFLQVHLQCMVTIHMQLTHAMQSFTILTVLWQHILHMLWCW